MFLVPIILLLTVQGLFYSAQNDQAEIADAAVMRVFSDRFRAGNPYLIAQALEGLEEGGITKCTRLKKAGSDGSFLDTTFKGSCNVSPYLLEGSNRTLVLTALNGERWLVSFVAVNPHGYMSGLWIARFLAVAFGLLLIFWFRSRIASIQRLHQLQRQESELRERLASQFAHDIRTPLAVLKQALKNDETRLASKLTVVSDRVRTMSDELLRGRRNPVGWDLKVPDIECFDLIDTANDLVNEIAIIADDNDVQFESSNQTIKIRGSKNDFSRALENLIKNAIEASNVGDPVQVRVEISQGYAQVKIVDRGHGIPPEALSKIGERGFTTGKTDGNGLGLWYARETVERMGGSLRVVSELANGTHISLTIPLAEPERSPLKPTAQSTPMKAILIEDDPWLREAWVADAQAKGINLIALECISDDSFWLDVEKSTLILLDYDLGGEETGEEIAIRLASLGFNNIYLQTGHPTAMFSHLAAIRGVIGKDPPDWQSLWGRET